MKYLIIILSFFSILGCSQTLGIIDYYTYPLRNQYIYVDRYNSAERASITLKLSSEETTALVFIKKYKVFTKDDIFVFFHDYFYKERNFTGVIFTNLENIVEININTNLTKEQIEILKNIFNSNLKITIKLKSKKEEINLNLTDKDRREFLKQIQLIFSWNRKAIVFLR